MSDAKEILTWGKFLRTRNLLEGIDSTREVGEPTATDRVVGTQCFEKPVGAGSAK